ncbi:MAG: hypothetical protein QUS14_04395 [Pyrinomonadaceae bacterium]|nr:hypothetical protein [Pyrinomonadaceae bacterium]
MTTINYNGRTFIAEENSANGEVGGGTVFHYHQEGSVVWAEYSGGDIVLGRLIANASQDGRLDMRYQHINIDGELMTGICETVPELLSDGRLRLHESWQWTSGDRSSGTSTLIETKE